ncbi:probable E3 ubiquitin-protein ligase makorin-1 [Pollicipes pollicipes]|uniref:probable E3 ubiquitin-protein ligase makorin-1 n=1 Tax=Pollicipes pollicipes TaxID=41117 RepID=UPI001884A55A|nr:probable E3 ubiquitin-protein ligase makorin-1 [Pollicipes pollicipes]XP_037070564.1 probable E3 ubiquitin-protein ligase makorin-1 [Pollicipes pollicipes]XP_037070635.1 probable E3 ubiquitin-protein ligase makorin-1 [Pollicipes pollicipes]XP_037070636.1 probable E3 ubiquitin-protein ligase makorin-1 [Pollicipes pollicipes]XP_037070637.1 probable E3 ubiquitin-protein ligase makorin-1 [Pollicipes pollicipes]
MAEGWTNNVLCRYFMYGTCRNGTGCTYSHDSNLARPTLPCRFYKCGTCAYGSKCQYLHETQAEAAGRQSAADAAPTAAGQPSKTGGNGGRRPMKDICLRDMSTGARVPVNWADAPEFVPSSGRVPPASGPDTRSYAAVVQPSGSGRDPDDAELVPLCPYAAVGECRYGVHCVLLHGDVCEYCQCAVLHPNDAAQRRRHRAECLSTHEKDMEHSFRMAKSIDKMCGICMEVVVEKKELSARRFGILPSCSHCFCVACIRQWRSSSQFEAKVTRGCPECRVHSDFICPSRYWVDDSEEKTKLINDYIKSCSNKPCKHFNEGRGECPFGNKCFYRHTYPDGRQAELGPPRRRRRQNHLIETELMSDVMLSDFLSDEMRALDEEDADEAIRLNLMIIQAGSLMDIMFPSDSDDE